MWLPIRIFFLLKSQVSLNISHPHKTYPYFGYILHINHLRNGPQFCLSSGKRGNEVRQIYSLCTGLLFQDLCLLVAVPYTEVLISHSMALWKMRVTQLRRIHEVDSYLGSKILGYQVGHYTKILSLTLWSLCMEFYHLFPFDKHHLPQKIPLKLQF